MFNRVFKPIYKGMFKGLVSSGDVPGLRDVYLFDGSELDALTISPAFSGNVKVILAAPAETGVHPDLIAGRVSDFVASTDPVNAPQWVQYEIEATSLAYIVDATFDGVVCQFAFDDVWYTVDMGVPSASVAQWVNQTIWS